MATIKSYSDLEQSRKLAEILPLESADMYYNFDMDFTTGEFYFPADGSSIMVRRNNKPLNLNLVIPCWSLAALLGVLPTLDGRNVVLCKDIRCDEWHIFYHSTATLSIIDTERYDNPIDACYELILKLKERYLL